MARAPLAARVRPAALAALAFLAVQAVWLGHIFPSTSDTAGYVGIAWRIAHTGRLADPVAYLGRPVPDPALHWPPGLPAVLAAFSAAGLDPASGGRALSVAAGAFVAALLAATLASLVRGRALAIACAWAVLTPATTLAAQRVTAEPLYTALAFSSLVLAEGAAGRPTARAAWFEAGLLAGLATGTRWAGVALAPALAVAWIAAPRRPVRARIAAAVWTVLGAALVVVPLAWWRVQAGGGPRVPFAGSPWTVLAFAGSGLADVLFVGTLGAGIVPALLAVEAARGRGGPPPGERARTTALIHGMFAAASIALLVATGFFVYFDSLDLRTLAPVVPSTLVLATLGAAAVAPRIARAPSRLPALALGLVSVAVLHGAVLTEALTRLPDPDVATRDVAELASRLPPATRVPVLTVNPMVAVPRPDLLWRRPQRGPNDALVPLDVVLALHPEHRGGLVVFPRDLADSWARDIRPDFCVRTTCLGTLPGSGP